jgi:P27 family predicted phage terminase small subunit
MRGRKPKPVHLKVLEGTRSSSASSPVASLSEIKVPTCPQHLCPTAKAEWKRLARELHTLGILTSLDRSALAAYCQSYGRWVEAEQRLKETPALLKMPSGYVQQNPWLTISAKQLELMHRYLGELGLSPVARARVDITRRREMRNPRPWRPADAFLKA